MKTESAGKYVFVVVKGHPMADGRGRILMHRYVMAEAIGRALRLDEVVHHKNGNRRDNRLENLELMTRGEHTRLHTPAKIVHFTCPSCGNSFSKTKRQRKYKNAYCSRSCANQQPSKQHGTYARYRGGCRCVECRIANARRIRAQRQKSSARC